ncbi:hypothetical protein CEXT_733921 [Caerostris extrusa]|uniref:Uncharacterized protein n=1 Tax=Caerostris extrusa TaxID=172846 RepID=A0AAV4WAY8_CAEEX|nr:hypothetical protein CEXT_733921 [Caerostris extrusa]
MPFPSHKLARAETVVRVDINNSELQAAVLVDKLVGFGRQQVDDCAVARNIDFCCDIIGNESGTWGVQLVKG